MMFRNLMDRFARHHRRYRTRLSFERIESRLLMASDFSNRTEWHSTELDRTEFGPAGIEAGLGEIASSFSIYDPVAVGELICFQYAVEESHDSPVLSGFGSGIVVSSQFSTQSMSILVDHLGDEDDGDHTTGNLSLREAVGIANANVGADEISFAPSLAGGTLTLTIGELSITDDVRITGLGKDLLTISGGDTFRVFNIATASSTLEALTISNGRTTTAVQFGGGIRNSGNLEIINSAISNNHTLGVAADGGGIFQLGGQLTITNSEITNNSIAGDSALGGGIGTLSARVTIADSLIAGNQTMGRNGGGAGVSVVQGILDMVRTTVSENESSGSSSEGAGVLASASFQIVDSAITSNRSEGRAGGVLLSDTSNAPGLIRNSTISGNVAQAEYGGGIAVDGGRLTIEHSTITDNSATSGEGDGIASRFDADFPSIVLVRSSIIAGNGVSDVHEVIANNATIDSDGFNLIGLGNAVGAFSEVSDQANVLNPGLASLGDHGGTTATHPLLPTSLAINAGDPSLNSGTTAPLNDQRGQGRVFGSAIDIGAYEARGFDFGDAPQHFPTLLVDQGASHEAIGVQLGDMRDVEPDGQPSPTAIGDGADEGGLVFDVIAVGSSTADVQVSVSGASGGFVNAWVDWDGDGDWQSDEQILIDEAVSAGTQSLTYPVPLSAVLGETFARVRISSASGLEPNGHAVDGEVEDYLVEVQQRPSVEQVTIADGTPQRSMVTEITVQFDSEVNVLDSAFALTHRDTGQAVSNFSVFTQTSNAKTTTIISFQAGVSTSPLKNGGFTLVNGNYQLVIDAREVTQVGTGLAMASEFIFGAQQSDAFFRLYGDFDGDRDVDGLDLGAFGQAFLTQSGQVGYQASLDSDGDGDIDGLDLGAFGQSFLKTI